MNIFSLIFLILISNTLSSDVPSLHSRFTTNTIMHQILEMFRAMIKNGSVDSGVPLLDPYVFTQMQFDYRNEIFSVKGNINSGKFTGLGDFITLSVEFNKTEIAMDVNVNFPLLTFQSENYEMHGNIFEAIPITGKGVIDIKIHDLLFWGKIYLKQSENGKSILVDYIENPRFTIKTIVSGNEFDNNIDDIFNMLTEDLLATYINRFNKIIANSYSSLFAQYLNPMLDKFETWRLIAIIL